MNDIPDFYETWAANGGAYSDCRTECRDYDDYERENGMNAPQDNAMYRAPRTATEANDMIREMKEDAERFDLFAKTCDAKIDFYKRQKAESQVSYESERQYKEKLLAEYIKTAPTKKAKNSESLKLPDGTIRRTFATTKLVPDEFELVNTYRGTQYVETVEHLRWGELKKLLAQDDSGNVIDTETGEIVAGVTVEAVDEKISVQ